MGRIAFSEALTATRPVAFRGEGDVVGGITVRQGRRTLPPVGYVERQVGTSVPAGPPPMPAFFTIPSILFYPVG